VGNARLDVAGRIQREVEAVLAGEAGVVGRSPQMAVCHDDHIPVVGHFRSIGRVEPQRPAPNLLDRCMRGRAAKIDEDVRGRRVPALAEQRTGSHQAS
jgi:hypothetical protein